MCPPDGSTLKSNAGWGHVQVDAFNRPATSYPSGNGDAANRHVVALVTPWEVVETETLGDGSGTGLEVGVGGVGYATGVVNKE
jgi:hypothetical protein